LTLHYQYQTGTMTEVYWTIWCYARKVLLKCDVLWPKIFVTPPPFSLSLSLEICLIRDKTCFCSCIHGSSGVMRVIVTTNIPHLLVWFLPCYEEEIKDYFVHHIICSLFWHTVYNIVSILHPLPNQVDC